MAPEDGEEEEERKRKRMHEEELNVQKRVRQEEPTPENLNGWLFDTRLDEARVGIHKTMEAMRKCEEYSADMQELWQRLQSVEHAHSTMARMMGLTTERRNAGSARDRLAGDWARLSDELTQRLKTLEEITGLVVAEFAIKPKSSIPEKAETDLETSRLVEEERRHKEERKRKRMHEERAERAKKRTVATAASRRRRRRRRK